MADIETPTGAPADLVAIVLSWQAVNEGRQYVGKETSALLAWHPAAPALPPQPGMLERYESCHHCGRIGQTVICGQCGRERQSGILPLDSPLRSLAALPPVEADTMPTICSGDVLLYAGGVAVIAATPVPPYHPSDLTHLVAIYRDPLWRLRVAEALTLAVLTSLRALTGPPSPPPIPQEDLPADAAKILRDNLPSLYDDEPSPPPQTAAPVEKLAAVFRRLAEDQEAIIDSEHVKGIYTNDFAFMKAARIYRECADAIAAALSAAPPAPTPPETKGRDDDPVRCSHSDVGADTHGGGGVVAGTLTVELESLRLVNLSLRADASNVALALETERKAIARAEAAEKALDALAAPAPTAPTEAIVEQASATRTGEVSAPITQQAPALTPAVKEVGNGALEHVHSPECDRQPGSQQPAPPLHYSALPPVEADTK